LLFAVFELQSGFCLVILCKSGILLIFKKMAEADEQLRNIVKWRAKSDANHPIRLGDAVKQLVEERISPRQAGFELIVGLWRELLPEGLHRHCRIAGISGGRLEVLVDSPLYANELRWCSSELLEQIKRQCPQARIEKIQFVVG